MYYVDSEGSCIEGNAFAVGSGGTYAYSVLDSLNIPQYLSSNPSPEDLDATEAIFREKALDRALWAVRHATYRDGYSGGYLNLLEINSTGVHHLRRIDCRLLDISSQR